MFEHLRSWFDLFAEICTIASVIDAFTSTPMRPGLLRTVYVWLVKIPAFSIGKSNQ